MNGIRRVRARRKVFCAKCCNHVYYMLYSSKTVYRLTYLITNNITSCDIRGKHLNRCNCKSDKILIHIGKHINIFEKKLHIRCPIYHILESSLTVDYFIQKHPKHLSEVKYIYFT